MMVTYSWRKGFHARIKAEVAAAELEKISEAHNGKLDPEHVVEAAKPKRSPLHAAFDWDNRHAAHEWRKNQARTMTRSLIEYEIIEGKNEPVEHRVYEFVTLKPDDKHGEEQRVYMPTTLLLASEETREQLLDRARREADSYRRRYAALTELADVFAAMDRVFEGTD